MKISELNVGQGKVDVDVEVKSKEEPRMFEKYGKPLKVANAIVFDSSGEMKMSLWNDDVDKIKVGDKLKIVNGYVSEFNGVKQLSAGKFGKIEVIGKENVSEHVKEPSKEKKEKKKVDVEEVEF